MCQLYSREGEKKYAFLPFTSVSYCAEMKPLWFLVRTLEPKNTAQKLECWLGAAEKLPQLHILFLCALFSADIAGPAALLWTVVSTLLGLERTACSRRHFSQSDQNHRS